MKNCNFCHKELADNEVCSCKESKDQSKQKTETKKKILLGIIGIALIVVISILVITIGTASVKIDPFNYIEVSFDGYNSNGSAVINFDKDSLICDIIGEEPNSFDELAEWSNKYGIYSDGIEYYVTPSNNLSNGDNVTVSVTISGTAQKKIKSAMQDYTVEGLIKVEKIDVFKDIEIVFEGISGKGRLILEYKSDSDYLKACKIKGMEQYALSNGDKITLTIDNVDELAKTYGKIPQENSCEYEVLGLNAYVTETKQFSRELLKNITEQFMKEEQKNNEEENDSSFSYSTVKYYSTYFMFPKEDAFMASENELHIVIYYDSYYNNEYLRTNYIPLVFKDIVISEDNFISLKYEDGINATFTTEMKSYLEELEEKYAVEEIKDLSIEALPEKEVENNSTIVETKSQTTLSATPPTTQTPTTTPSTTVVKQRADIKTGISWDGVSPIIYTYPDGSTGTQIREGAKHEVLPGIFATIAYFQVPGYVAPPPNYTCSHCGKTKGDGTNGTCVRWLLSAVDCPNCGVHVEVRTCHTCDN